MRAYHQFSLNRSNQHLLVAFGILVLPLVSLLIFSFVNKVSFTLALGDLLISIWRLYVAFVIATIAAWLLVVLLVRGKTESPVLAIFDVLQSMPTFIILPIAVHFFGVSEATIIVFLALAIIWPVIFSIVSSLKQIDRSWHEAMVISRIRGFNYVRYFLFPVTVPGIVTGAIIGLGDGWEALIATELLLKIKTGVGPFFDAFSNNSSMTLFGVLIFLSIIFASNKFIWLPLLEKSHRLISQ